MMTQSVEISQCLELDPHLDVSGPRDRFGAKGFTTVEPLLTSESANNLLQRVRTWPYWNLVTCVDGEHRDFDAAGMHALPAEKRTLFDQLVFAEAIKGFQYLYENFALYESGRNDRLDDAVMAAAFRLVRSEEFLNVAREITGFDDISFADCQLTRYRGGHFLTLHDDDVPDKNRRAAYVLNLTPDWRSDYGGILQFIDDNGDLLAGITPGFNRLALFRVPCKHAVSCVAPFAPHARIAITGWLRAGNEPPV